MSGSVGDFVGPARLRHPPEHRAHFGFAGVNLTVESNDALLLAELRDYYREFPGEPDPSAVVVTALEAPAPDLGACTLVEQDREPGKALKERWGELRDGRVVHKVRTGMVFVFGGAQHLGIGPARANLPQIVNFVNNRYMQAFLDRGCVLGHCAALARRGTGVALAGRSGGGKSTLALHAMVADPSLSFVSNDRVLVRADEDATRVWGVPKHPRINPGTALTNAALAGVLSAEDRARYADMPTAALWDVEHKHDAPITECFGAGRFRLAADLRALIVLTWRRSEGPAELFEVDAARRRELLPAVAKSPGVFFAGPPGEPRFSFPDETYLHHLARVRVFELRGGVDFAAGVAAVGRIFGEVGGGR